MQTQLPAYTGLAARCPKCTCPDIGDQYRAGVPRISWDGADLHLATDLGDNRECMLRRCSDCGWAWLEACADADASQESDHQ